MELVEAIVKFAQANWPAIETVGRNLAVDLAALWVLLKAFAKVVQPFLPGAAARVKSLTDV